MTRGERQGGRSREAMLVEDVDVDWATASISASQRGRSSRVPDFRGCPGLESR